MSYESLEVRIDFVKVDKNKLKLKFESLSKGFKGLIDLTQPFKVNYKIFLWFNSTINKQYSKRFLKPETWKYF